MQTASVLFRPAPLALALAFLLLAVAALQAAEMAMLDSIEYDVYHKGKKIGRMSYSISEQAGDHGPLLKTRRSMEFGVRFLLLLKISVEAREETLRNEDGTYSFSRQGKARGHTAIQKGYFDGSKLACDTEIDGKLKHQEFDDSLFDCTSLDSPEAALAPGDEKTIRVLNLEGLKVRKRTLRCLRYEDLYVGNDTVACKVFGNGKDLAWFTRDRYGIFMKDENEDPYVVSFRPVAVIWKRAEKP